LLTFYSEDDVFDVVLEVDFSEALLSPAFELPLSEEEDFRP